MTVTAQRKLPKNKSAVENNNFTDCLSMSDAANKIIYTKIQSVNPALINNYIPVCIIAESPLYDIGIVWIAIVIMSFIVFSEIVL